MIIFQNLPAGNLLQVSFSYKKIGIYFLKTSYLSLHHDSVCIFQPLFIYFSTDSISAITKLNLRNIHEINIFFPTVMVSRCQYVCHKLHQVANKYISIQYVHCIIFEVLRLNSSL